MGDDVHVPVCISRSRFGASLGCVSSARGVLLVASFSVALLIVVYMYSQVPISACGQTERVLRSATMACSHDESRRYLQELCHRYQRGTVAGTLCEPLCISREIQYTQCFPGGRDKIFVAQARWGKREVALKTIEAPKVLSKLLTQYATLTVEEFKRKTTAVVQSTLGTYDNTSVIDSALNNILSECGIHRDKVLNSNEIRQCSRLVQQEYMLYHILRGNPGIPDLYGACGELFAIENASPEELWLPHLYIQQWRRKAELAIAVLDMIVALERTPYGTLYLCDMDRVNLGVVRKPGGGVVVKTIDNDKSYFEAGLQNMVAQERPCNTDYDCRVVRCSVPCNMTTHTCSHKAHVNNLQMACKFIFQMASLLTGPPTWVKGEMESLLQQCTESGKTHDHIPQDIIDRLYVVLWKSLLVL